MTQQIPASNWIGYKRRKSVCYFVLQLPDTDWERKTESESEQKEVKTETKKERHSLWSVDYVRTHLPTQQRKLCITSNIDMIQRHTTENDCDAYCVNSNFKSSIHFVGDWRFFFVFIRHTHPPSILFFTFFKQFICDPFIS